MSRLTKAQGRFMQQIADGSRFEMMDLLGSEVRMAQRLIAAGLIQEQRNTVRILRVELHLTDVGRAALSDQQASGDA